MYKRCNMQNNATKIWCYQRKTVFLRQLKQVLERSYINDFHRQNSMGAVKEVESMLLHPYSREQKLAQINSLRQNNRIKK